MTSFVSARKGFVMSNRDAQSDERLEAVRHRLLSRLMPFEVRFAEERERLWTASLLAPLGIGLLALGAVCLWAGEAFAKQLLWTSLAAVCFFGRWTILAGAPGGLGEVAGLPTSAQLFVMLTCFDVIIAIWLTLHLGYLLTTPAVGPKLGRWIARGQRLIDRRPWMKHVRFPLVTAFAIWPRAATVTFGSMIFGRLLGMGRFTTLAAVVLGSVLGNGLMYFGSELINAQLDKSRPVVQYVGLLVGTLVLGLWKYRSRMAPESAPAVIPLRGAGKV